MIGTGWSGEPVPDGCGGYRNAVVPNSNPFTRVTFTRGFISHVFIVQKCETLKIISHPDEQFGAKRTLFTAELYDRKRIRGM